MQALSWRTSSYSAEGANCVNLAIAPDGTVRLRDSKAPRTVVATSADALRHFIGAVQAGTLERR
ncbi:MAG TPA: DUF397 domain-containing protein [Streptomyces sp.]|uniref:DUF397 domain-containing protein n=1 Tax=Streptomyces sp. TaxID=1931 RepID=UPI002B5D7044|nr:DUF397 domain-containing protein [Streptomyces sp.]HWU08268.1 DUF397 domain-containing protein [Streptomyces sp.]